MKVGERLCPLAKSITSMQDILIQSVTLRNLFNGFIFYLGWFLCMFGAAHQNLFFPLLATFMLIGLDLCYTRLQSISVFYQDLFLISLTVISGFLLESIFLVTGILAYASPNAFSPAFPPLWIISIYILFATSLNHSFSWLKARPFFACLMGAIGAPLTYLAGQRMDVVTFLLTDGQTMLILGLAWALYFPFMLWCANSFPVSTSDNYFNS